MKSGWNIQKMSFYVCLRRRPDHGKVGVVVVVVVVVVTTYGLRIYRPNRKKLV